MTEFEFSNVRQLLLLRLATWKFIVENKFMTCVCPIEVSTLCMLDLLDPDQDQNSVHPDLDLCPNCLQRL